MCDGEYKGGSCAAEAPASNIPTGTTNSAEDARVEAVAEAAAEAVVEDAMTKGSKAGVVSDTAQLPLSADSECSVSLAAALVRVATVNVSRSFDVALTALTHKLNRLNDAQDAATAACDAVDAARRPALPVRLACPTGIAIAVHTVLSKPTLASPPSPPSATAPSSGTPYAVRLVCTTRDGSSLTTTHNAQVTRALTHLVSCARRGVDFAPDELPGCDVFEQVALCARLRALGVLCACEDRRADGESAVSQSIAKIPTNCARSCHSL